ncbi:MAG: NUDIX hydrolase [Clostridium sp.]|nr:NUDIX hydrolase [Clostridium sp.]MCI7441908.1 NUDIX hydrolase [Clostridium sp.]
MNNIEEKEFLKNYDASKFERPSVTNDVLIFTTEDKKEENSRKVPRKGLQVLLIKRDEYPYKGKWSVPGGFVKMDESLEEGALRKLKEKTGIENVYLEQLYTFGEVDRDPRTRIISIGNLALISKDSIIYSENAENKETKWFWVDKILEKKEVSDNYITKKYLLTLECEDIKINYEVIEKTERTLIRKTTKSYRFLEEESTEELAFDHCKILDLGIDRLRNKLEYTPIVFNLLPRLFTVKELQFVYEAIMGREILNFRRKMGNMIIETEEKIEGKPFRPAQVFKFNENWEHEF